MSPLSPEKLRLLRRQRGARDTDPALLRAGLSGAAHVPASMAQRALWFLDRVMEPSDRSAYNLGKAMVLRGPLEPKLFERCLTEIVRRHQVLRTTFTAEDGTPMQVVHDSCPVRLPVRDLSALPQAERAAAVRLLAEEELSRPFDLAQDPLFRALLVRSAPAEHTLVLVFHHAVFDGWSFGIFFDELIVLYEAFGAGCPSPLAEPTLQYTDYSVWQQTRFDQGALAEGLAYWRRALAGAPGLLALPTDRPRPATASYTGAQFAFILPPELTAAVRSRAAAEGCTLYMVLLAAYQVLLARLSGQQDVLVGSPIAGRSRPALEGLVGFFVNTVVLRGEVADELTFREYLGRTRQTVLEAFEHQDVPFELVVEELKPERTLSHNPLFQAVFTLQNTAAESSVQLPGIEVAPCAVTTRDAKFDLVLDVVEDGDTLRCEIGYRTDMFDPETVERLSHRYAQLLAQVLADPERALGNVDLLLPGEVSELMRYGRGPAVPGAPATLHGLIEEQVHRTPDAPAVLCDGIETTYAELNTRAERLARFLRARGVGPERVVAVQLPRSVDAVIAFLAVLKAGGAYLPLDPSHPAQRIAFMLQDAQPVCVLTDRDLATADDLCEPEVPSAEAAIAHPAYVLYTSGSTGQPKGVVVPHSAAVNLVRWTVSEFGEDQLSRVLCAASFSFDASVFELFAPLACGGRVEIVRDVLALAERDPQAGGTTLISGAPSAMTVLAAQRRLPAGTTTVVNIGEALPGALIEEVLQVLPKARVFNGYGPTETTVWAAHWSTDAPVSGLPPIGQPVGGDRLYVLDPGLDQVPTGVAGELHVAGAGLARGYLNRPELTAERFLPDPYAGPGERMYRTGDLARWRSDGLLEYLGRTDHQVKIRGYRVELGEVEGTLRSHPAIRQAAVLARGDVPGELQLVAYIVPGTPAGPPPVSELRGWLSRTLPAYMVPAAFVTLAELPLTDNGKLDRARLPAPTADRPARKTAERPSTPHERQVADVWAEILHRDDIGLHDNFFDLGGNSLAAMRMVARIEQAGGRAIRPASVFQAPTVEQLAALLSEEDKGATGSASPLVTLCGSGAGAPVFLVHPLGGNILCYAGLGDELGPDRPVHGLVARGLSHDEVPRERVEAMAAAYLAALPKAATDRHFLLAGWSMGGVVALEMARQFLQSTGRPLPVVMMDSYPPQPTAHLHGSTGSRQDEVALLADFAADWGRSLDLDLSHTDLAEIGVRAGLEWLLARAKAAGVLSPDDDLVLLHRLFRTHAAHAVALDHYRPATPYPGPVTLLSARSGRVGDAVDHGWSRLVTGPLGVVEVPGDHYSILREPQLPDTAAVLRAQLKASDPS
ncbi:non-ribosomal peptide synthetase [Streptomyces sp. NBC_01217]|uniref:non-ribosomal peptide synthetase n=1 Tax=Streptomyces sp. NBC_01217 TaxID=2903779 RepID=UPI002E15C122|nr:amino acid adenylation domain-containing protein [Streptomyces sp. NBC_01217]